MNKKIFGRDRREAELQDLYRQAEQGGDVPDMAPELQGVFAEDQQLMQQLGHLAHRSAPVNPMIARATLLAAVARQRSESLKAGRGPVLGRLMTGRALALLATAGIFAGGAVTVGASGGAGSAAGNVLTALHITERTPNKPGTQVDRIDQPGGPATPAAEETKPAVGGVPTANTQHQAADTTETCDRSETIVKTMPSGAAVNAPCQTGSNRDQGDGSSHSDRTRGAGEAPEANATEPSKQSGEGADKTLAENKEIPFLAGWEAADSSRLAAHTVRRGSDIQHFHDGE